MNELTRELSPRDGYAAWAECYDEDGNPLIPLEGPAIVAKRTTASSVFLWPLASVMFWT